jgi:hypothetical protein
MTELELTLSAIYGTVMTMYPSSQDAIRTPIRFVSNPHSYQITISWTPLSILALVAAVVVFVYTVWQALCWARAIMSLEARVGDRNLLKPLSLMGYSTIVVEELNAMMRDDEDGKLKVPKDDAVGLGPTVVVRVSGHLRLRKSES